MSIFSAIKKAIFGDHGPLGGQLSGGAKTQPAPAGQPAAPRPAPAAQPQVAPVQPAPAAAAQAPVDVEKILADKAAAAGEPSNWRTSIVDLLKLLDLDSSLAARKELAEEIGYAGPKDGSAEMNIAVHKAVMRKLAENGGKVPADLTD